MKRILMYLLSLILTASFCTGNKNTNKTGSFTTKEECVTVQETPCEEKCEKEKEICTECPVYQEENEDEYKKTEEKTEQKNDKKEQEEKPLEIIAEQPETEKEDNKKPECENGNCIPEITGQNTLSDVRSKTEEFLKKYFDTVNRSVVQNKKTEEKKTETDIANESQGEIYDVFNIVNEERAKNGKGKLEYRYDLQNAANTRAREIVESFSHTRPDGRKCFTVLDENGIRYYSAGENIAYGQRSAYEVMNGWMNSQGHRENILSGNFSGVCVGLYEKNGIKYWVQIFVG